MLSTDRPTVTERTARSMALPAAKISLGTAIAFLVLLILLHFLKPEFDPSWHFISEYALGRYGWIMVVAFLAFATSYISLFFTIRTQISRTAWGKIGLAFILISGAGLVMGGIFITDPLGTPTENMTTSGALHNVGGTLGMAMPFASILITWKLSKNQAWASARRAIIWAAVFATTGFIISFGSLAVMLGQSHGRFGQDVLVGWPNRLEILGYAAWVITIAYYAIRIRNAEN